MKGCKDCPIAKAFDRLAAIEDILGDLVQADRDGQCVVIPPDLETESDYEIICRTINPEYVHLRKVFGKSLENEECP